MNHYKIADHLVQIDFGQQAEEYEALLPNFLPFLCQDDGGVPVLSVDIMPYSYTENDRTNHTGQEKDIDPEKEIGKFDVGGGLHEVYRKKDGGYRIIVNDSLGHMCACLISDGTFTHCQILVSTGSFQQRAYGLNNCMMMAYAFATATMDTVLIHSSVIRCDGRGYLMTAPSGTGKSTHTHLWYTHIPGCDLMNDDNPIIRILPENGQAMVYGSPWSGKTRCYRNISAPIGGIVRLHQSPQNSICRMSPAKAFAELLPACSNMSWDERVHTGVCDSVTKFVQSCGIWEMGCLPNGDAAILCHDTITGKNC